MITTDIVIITLILLIAGIYGVLYYTEIKFKRQIKEIKRLEARNSELYHFRVKVLHMYGQQAYNQLPDRDSMLYSKKELTVKEWIKIDEIINLN